MFRRNRGGGRPRGGRRRAGRFKSRRGGGARRSNERGGPFDIRQQFRANPVAGILSDASQTRRLTVERAISGPGFADRAMVRLRWSAVQNVTFTSGAGQALLVDGNGAYQPGNNFSNTSNPQWWNRYAAVYGNYRTHACNIMVQIEPVDSTSSTTIGFSNYLFPHNNPTAVASGTAALNNPHMKKWDTYTSYNSTQLQAPNVNYPTVTGHMRVSKLQGMTQTEFQGDNGNTQVVTALPTRYAWWQIFMVPKQTPTSVTVAVWIVTDHLVEFFERLPGDDNTRLLREIALNKREAKLAKRPEAKDTCSPEELLAAKEHLYGSMDNKECVVDSDFDDEPLRAAGSVADEKSEMVLVPSSTKLPAGTKVLQVTTRQPGKMLGPG